MISFKNQNLQNRSFQHQVLNGADFSGTDIRGCNFNHAQLVGANFEQAKVGLLPQKFILLSGLTIAIALWVADALSRLIFSALGQLPNSRAWSFVLLLYGVLSLAGVSTGVGLSNRISVKTSRIASLVSAALSGALLGFLYAGSASGNNPSSAIAGAVAAGLVMVIGSLWIDWTLLQIAIATVQTVTVYAAAFLLGATASMSLSAQQFDIGLTCAIAALVYVWLAFKSLKGVVRSLKLAATTTFKGADLTQAQFDQADSTSLGLTH